MTRCLWIGAALVGVLSSTSAAQSTSEQVRDGSVLSVLGDTDQILDLSACLDQALQANPLVRQEREGLKELGGQVIQARATGLPRFDLQANWSRARDPSFALDETFGGDGDGGLGTIFDPIYEALGLEPLDPGTFAFLPDPADIPPQSFWRTYIETHWELRPTRVLRAIRAAQKGLDRQRAIVVDAENRTMEDVIGAFHGVVLAHERLLAVESEITARDEFLQITRRRFALDLATPLDTLQAAVGRANLVPERRRREQELRSAGQQLNLLMGKDAQTPLSVRAEFPIEDDPVPVEDALHYARNRPDVERDRLQTELLRIQRGTQKATNHPYLTVDGSYGYVSRDLGGLTDDGHDFWRTSVSVTWPIWDGQVVRGQVRETEAAIRRSEFVLDDRLRRAEGEVLEALDRLEVARSDLQAAGLNMEMAERALAQVTLRYELGKADQLEVLNAQAERFAARSNLLRARYEVLSTTATLKRAMGVSPRLSLAEAIARVRSETTP